MPRHRASSTAPLEATAAVGGHATLFRHHAEAADAFTPLAPPLLAGDGAAVSGDYSIVVRDDGQKQIAYKGKPLYYWVKDGKAGDTTGDGVMGVWHTARP